MSTLRSRSTDALGWASLRLPAFNLKVLSLEIRENYTEVVYQVFHCFDRAREADRVNSPTAIIRCNISLHVLFIRSPYQSGAGTIRRLNKAIACGAAFWVFKCRNRPVNPAFCVGFWYQWKSVIGRC